MLTTQKKFIKKELWKHKLIVDVDALIDNLYKNGKIDEFMGTDTIYAITLVNLSLQHPIYKRLLSKNYLYDLEFELVKKGDKINIEMTNFDENSYDLMVKSNMSKPSSEIQEIISNILKPHIEYTFVCYILDKYYIMVKYKDILEDYNKIPITLEAKLKENQLIKQDLEIVFNEKIIPVENRNLNNVYKEFINHVKAIKLPLQIIDDDCFGLDATYKDIIDVYIQLEYSDKWPKDSVGVEYVKTAFYCEIYKRSKFKHYVDEFCVVLKYKKTYFKLTILENIKTNFVLKKNFYKSLEFLAKTVPNIKNNIMMVKKYLSSHGYYPFYFDDFLVDVICLSLKRINCPSRFLKEFLNFNFEHKKINVETLEVQDSKLEHFSIFKKLDNLVIDLPELSVIKRLKVLNKILIKNSYELLQTNYLDFDFCLSYFPRKKFKQIEENNNNISKFIDWQILNKKEVKKNAYIYYSDYNKMVMVKGKDECDIDGLFYYFLSTTSFKFYFKK